MMFFVQLNGERLPPITCELGAFAEPFCRAEIPYSVQPQDRLQVRVVTPELSHRTIGFKSPSYFILYGVQVSSDGAVSLIGRKYGAPFSLPIDLKLPAAHPSVL